MLIFLLLDYDFWSRVVIVKESFLPFVCGPVGGKPPSVFFLLVFYIVIEDGMSRLEPFFFNPFESESGFYTP